MSSERTRRKRYRGRRRLTRRTSPILCPLESIQTALHEYSPLATVLQAIVASYLKGPTMLLVADVENHKIRCICLKDGTTQTISGELNKKGHADGDWESASFDGPYFLAVHKPSNTLLVGEFSASCIRRVSLDDFSVSTMRPMVVNKESGEPETLLVAVRGCVVVNDSLIVADMGIRSMRCLPLDGSAPSVLTSPHVRPWDSYWKVHCDYPVGLEADIEGNIFIADCWDNAIHKIDPAGVVSWVAGGRRGHKDGSIEEAQFNTPRGLAFDTEGNLLVCDHDNHCLRRVNFEAGTVTTVAGQPGHEGHKDGPGNEAQFFEPHKIVVDPTTEDIYVSCGNHTIRKVTRDGIVSTFGGQPGKEGGADGPVSLFNDPCGLVLV